MNAVEIADAVAHLFQQPFNPTEFPFAFLEAFGNKETTLKRLRRGDSNASELPGGVLQRNNIHLAVCTLGGVGATLRTLRESAKTAANKVKFILATDGEWLEAEDVRTGEPLATAYADTAAHFGFFLELAGITTVREIKNNPIDIRATGRLNKLYVELLKDNPEWAAESKRPDMNHFMARLIFCFFAEDTHIFHGDGLFTQTVDQMTERDGSNVHEVLGRLFEAMNLSLEARKAAELPLWAEAFPYVNGGLFSGALEAPHFSRVARSYLLRAGDLNWREINPDIFGSMIQAVADDEERGALGMHYTSVPNILKVLNPLFLDDLRAQLEAAGDSTVKLLNLRKRMARIRVFDPACGSGNFLVIAYKEMRAVEAEINRRRTEAGRASEIPLTNFRGVELRDFAAEIARLALIIAEYQCDVLYRGEKLALAEFLPLDRENWIVRGNALLLDWTSVCPPTGTTVKHHANDLFSSPLQQSEIEFANEGGEIYICGNPPYAGSSKQSYDQKEDIRRIFEQHTSKYKNLDYIACWFWLAGLFCLRTAGAAAFVSTNSICQGEQVSLLWSMVLKRDIEIFFAHTAFKWSNLASKNAGVTCVVVGIRSTRPGQKYLYSADLRREVSRINPYLLEFDDVMIPRHSESISHLPRMLKGNQPSDGGNLILSPSERRDLLTRFPKASTFIRKLYGSKELIDGLERFCLWIDDEQLEEARRIEDIEHRLEAVRKARLASPAKSTRMRANDSHRFIQIQDYDKAAIIVPEVSSEKREYLPCSTMGSREIATNKVFAIYEPELFVLSICLSRMHRVWIEAICGKLEERISYSNVLGYNSFPVPQLTEGQKAELTRCAEDILLAREAHFPATIADLYEPEAMPEDLRRAHDRNDETIERIYIGRRFKTDTERLERLFEMYTRMTSNMASPKQTAKRRKA